jgi:zinc/manganese transport system substrate-binding protein/zinc transport system substrate-binding protein
VAVPDVEAIVMAVGGNEVDTFSLFRGCILRKGLEVEPAVEARLTKANIVVWSGFLAESAAIQASLKRQVDRGAVPGSKPLWIDISQGTKRVNVPVSACFGSPDMGFVSGDPFFWLNPSNGATIARNVARVLGSLQPDKRKYYTANADAFAKALDTDIARWKEQLKPLAKLRVFSTQCGWQNFSRMGGPVFIVCKETPGSLPTPKLLIERLTQAKAQIVLLDPNTPPEYGTAFREQPDLRVVDMPSSVEGKPSAKSYNELFDNLVRTLLTAAADAPKQGAGN